MRERLPYSVSFQFLQSVGLLESGEIPEIPPASPRYDDEVLGVEFFRTCVEGIVLDGLTLPRTYFGRSEIRKVTFRGTDLSGSTANWNDFIDVDFSVSDLTLVDFRASTLERVVFDGATMKGVDLRHSTFKDCTFVDTDLTGAKLNRAHELSACLSSIQSASIDWHAAPGPLPDGG